MSDIKQRDAKKILNKNGYYIKRNCKTSHNVFTNGVHTIILPGHGDIAYPIWRNMVKEYQIRI